MTEAQITTTIKLTVLDRVVISQNDSSSSSNDSQFGRTTFYTFTGLVGEQLGLWWRAVRVSVASG